MNKIRSAVVAAAAVAALAGGLAAPASAATAQPQGWRLLFSDTHTPAAGWTTTDFVPATHVLGTNYRCWGHDGTKISAEIVRTRDAYVMAYNPGTYCHDGEWQTLTIRNATPGTSYYLRLWEDNGPKHSMAAKAYDYR